jgi:hypothetical protein
MGRINKPYIFIGDILNLIGTNEYILVGDYLLKKATEEHIQEIKNYILQLGGINDCVRRYEYEQISEREGIYNVIALEPDKWNYWIIEHSRQQVDEVFLKSLCLSKLELTPLIDFGQSSERGRSKGYSPLKYFSFIHDSNWDYNCKNVTQEEVEEIRNIHKLLLGFINEEYKYPYVKKALYDFYNLNMVSRFLTFKFVIMFSIIESLLIHNPKRGENSITGQLKSKIKLLNNRFKVPLSFSDYFRGPDSISIETIIEKLYEYHMSCYDLEVHFATAEAVLLLTSWVDCGRL